MKKTKHLLKIMTDENQQKRDKTGRKQTLVGFESMATKDIFTHSKLLLTFNGNMLDNTRMKFRGNGSTFLPKADELQSARRPCETLLQWTIRSCQTIKISINMEQNVFAPTIVLERSI